MGKSLPTIRTGAILPLLPTTKHAILIAPGMEDR
jgi:hypothetical protein